ncbi:MAG TPA: DUF167 domain-containing protein [Gemmatimonadales bacterium]|nr:DUF167 domain-containing protein [Gemmatimonadales bacterium]
MTWATAAGDGTRLALRVQPRASRNEVAGPHGDALKVRLAAPPVDGAANEALVRFLADALELPRAAVTLVGGLSSRSKAVQVAGLAPTEVARRLGVPAG